MRYYVVGPDNQVYGPADLAELRQWAQQGRVFPQTLLTDETRTRTFSAHTVLAPSEFPAVPLASPDPLAPPDPYAPRPCPQCGRVSSGTSLYCGFCGRLLRSDLPGPTPTSGLGGGALGCFLSLALLLLATLLLSGIGAVLPSAGTGVAANVLMLLIYAGLGTGAYFGLRRFVPGTATGAGFGMLVGAALLLGLAAVCGPMGQRHP